MKPKKYTHCPLCNDVALVKVVGQAHTWVCSECGLRVYPNRKVSHVDPRIRLKDAAVWAAEAKRSWKQ